MLRVKAILHLLVNCLVYALVITFVTTIVLIVLTRNLGEIVLLLSYGLLGEGGLSLVIGGLLASFSPTINKIGEVIVHSEPWDAKRQKEVERTARNWITTGVILFLIGLVISAF